MSEPVTRTMATRERLLEAAGEGFAEHGFRSATIQAISIRAGTNIAAVNYHFGDKEKLYEAVIAYAHHRAVGLFGADTPADLPPAEKLRAHIEGALRHLLDEGSPAWHGRLMAREMFEPTQALDAFVRDHIRPNHLRLAEIVRDLLGPHVDEEDVRRSVFSLIAQCLFYRHSLPVIERLHPSLPVGVEQVPALAEHITMFSLAGLDALKVRRKTQRAVLGRGEGPPDGGDCATTGPADGGDA